MVRWIKKQVTRHQRTMYDRSRTTLPSRGSAGTARRATDASRNGRDASLRARDRARVPGRPRSVDTRPRGGAVTGKGVAWTRAAGTSSRSAMTRARRDAGRPTSGSADVTGVPSCTIGWTATTWLAGSATRRNESRRGIVRGSGAPRVNRNNSVY